MVGDPAQLGYSWVRSVKAYIRHKAYPREQTPPNPAPTDPSILMIYNNAVLLNNAGQYVCQAAPLRNKRQDVVPGTCILPESPSAQSSASVASVQSAASVTSVASAASASSVASVQSDASVSSASVASVQSAASVASVQSDASVASVQSTASVALVQSAASVASAASAASASSASATSSRCFTSSLIDCTWVTYVSFAPAGSPCPTTTELLPSSWLVVKSLNFKMKNLLNMLLVRQLHPLLPSRPQSIRHHRPIRLA
jgi:hypothetical protein